jgi:hypothetical protein
MLAASPLSSKEILPLRQIETLSKPDVVELRCRACHQALAREIHNNSQYADNAGPSRFAPFL